MGGFLRHLFFMTWRQFWGTLIWYSTEYPQLGPNYFSINLDCSFGEETTKVNCHSPHVIWTLCTINMTYLLTKCSQLPISYLYFVLTGLLSGFSPLHKPLNCSCPQAWANTKMKNVSHLRTFSEISWLHWDTTPSKPQDHYTSLFAPDINC